MTLAGLAAYVDLMRWSVAFALVSSASFAVVVTACSDRRGDYAEDFTEEIEHICLALCEKDTTCVVPPVIEYDECMAACTGPGAMHEDSICGEAFRAWFGCAAFTATCEEYLATRHVDTDYLCKEETATVVELACGAPEGSD